MVFTEAEESVTRVCEVYNPFFSLATFYKKVLITTS